jgi:glucan 1,3-beta-glucosidase
MMKLALLFFLGTVSAQDASSIIRGVNLGGWLVMEPWITPNLFLSANEGVATNDDGTLQIVDEYTWRSAPDGDNDRRTLLQDHWNSWVTLDHLTDLKTAGITHLRIPVGYWYWNVTDGEPFESDVDIYPYALDLLNTLVNDWALNLGLKVLIDLHTAPGSQNGFDNSGRRGPIDVLEGDNLSRWNEVVSDISIWCKENFNEDAYFGIEVLNEPAGFYSDIWTAVTTDINPNGYTAVRDNDPYPAVIFQMAFQPFDAQDTYSAPEYTNTWFDDHNYQCFGDEYNEWALESNGWDQHLELSCDNLDYYAAAPMPSFVGEFSLAVTDCTIFLAGGVNGGCDMAANPDCLYKSTAESISGSTDLCDYYTAPPEEMPDDYKDFLKNYARAQMDGFEAANGWFFWNFRTEDEHAPDWDYLLGWREGWMPQNASAPETYCGTTTAAETTITTI